MAARDSVRFRPFDLWRTSSEEKTIGIRDFDCSSNGQPLVRVHSGSLLPFSAISNAKRRHLRRGGISRAEHVFSVTYSAAFRVITEKSFERWPSRASPKPSATMPRLSNSRIAAARLGMRFAKRQVSISLSSSGVSMICSRSPRLSSPTTAPQSPRDPTIQGAKVVSYSLCTVVSLRAFGNRVVGNPKLLLNVLNLLLFS